MPHVNRGEAFRNGVLERVRGMLAPGAESRLKAQGWWNAPPEAFVANLLDSIEKTPTLRHPSYKAPEGQTRLEHVLGVLPLTDEARAQLAVEKHVSWGTMPVKLMAQQATAFIQRPSSAHMLEVSPAMDPREGRVLDALNGHFQELAPGDRQRLAKSWAHDLGSAAQTEGSLVSSIARRLQAAGRSHGVEPIKADDARLSAHAREQTIAKSTAPASANPL